MKYQIPKTFMGKPVAGSLERVLAKLDKTSENKEKQENIKPSTDINPDDYIHLQSGIYIAKQRTHLNLNWYQTHEELHKQGLRMPTISEFIEYLNFLKTDYSDKQEASKIFNEITKIGNWRANWLDARFENINNQMHINYNHQTINNQLQPKNTEQLENCLMQDCYVDIFNINKQGLPTKELGNGYNQGKNAYFWYPRENCVARFSAVSDWADLYCDGDPLGADASLGVFSVCEANASQLKI
jgi:hypothetical protein